jgi:hypothetical protein
MALTIAPITATSSSWKVMARAWRTTRAQILISLSCPLIKDQSAMASGSSMQRKTVAKSKASAGSCSRAALMRTACKIAASSEVHVDASANPSHLAEGQLWAKSRLS